MEIFRLVYPLVSGKLLHMALPPFYTDNNELLTSLVSVCIGNIFPSTTKAKKYLSHILDVSIIYVTYNVYT